MSQVGSVMRPPMWKRMLSVRNALRVALVALILLVGGVVALIGERLLAGPGRSE